MSYILLVEDNPEHAKLAIRILNAAVFEVKHSLWGINGVQLARQERPDLILLDLELPQMTGLTVAAIITKELGASVPPIVALTSFSQDAYQQSAKQAGCVAFIGKPYPPQQLLATVNYLLNSTELDGDVVLL